MTRNRFVKGNLLQPRFARSNIPIFPSNDIDHFCAVSVCVCVCCLCVCAVSVVPTVSAVSAVSVVCCLLSLLSLLSAVAAVSVAVCAAWLLPLAGCLWAAKLPATEAHCLAAGPSCQLPAGLICQAQRSLRATDFSFWLQASCGEGGRGGGGGGRG